MDLQITDSPTQLLVIYTILRQRYLAGRLPLFTTGVVTRIRAIMSLSIRGQHVLRVLLATRQFEDACEDGADRRSFLLKRHMDWVKFLKEQTPLGYEYTRNQAR